MIHRFTIQSLFAVVAVGAGWAAEEPPANPGEPVEDPVVTVPPPPPLPTPVARPPRVQPARVADWATEAPPLVVVVEPLEPETQPARSSTPLPFIFSPPGESAAPPDLSLANSRPFTMGLGPSVLGPGIRSTLRTGLIYDDNINQDEGGAQAVSTVDPETGLEGGTDEEVGGEAQSDLIFSAGLSLQAEFGSSERGMALNYAIDGYFYSDHPEKDTWNHALGVGAYRQWGPRLASVNLGYSHTTGEDRDVAATTTQDIFNAEARLLHELGPIGRLRTGIDHSSTYYETDAYGDSRETSAHLGFERRIGSNLHVGIEGVLGVLTGGAINLTTEPDPEPVPAAPTDPAGATTDGASGGEATVSAGSASDVPDGGAAEADTGTGGTASDPESEGEGLDQTYEQINLTFEYQGTDRFNANASFGYEWRDTEGGEDDGGFVYELNMNYRLGRATLVRARGSRSTIASGAYNDTSRLSTNFEVSVSQPIGRRCVLSLAGGYERSEYGAEEGTAGAGRLDKFMYIRPSLSVGLTPRLSMSLFYEYRNNDSSEEDGVPDRKNQVGTQFTFNF